VGGGGGGGGGGAVFGGSGRWVPGVAGLEDCVATRVALLRKLMQQFNKRVQKSRIENQAKSKCIQVHKQYKRSAKVHIQYTRSMTKIRNVYVLRNRGGDPPPDGQYFDISQFVHTFCTLCLYV